MRNGRFGRAHRQVFARTGKFKVGMQFPGWIQAVFFGGKYDQVTVFLQHYRWENPFTQVVGLVGERPSGQIDGCCSIVVNLYPVRSLSVFVGDAVGINRHKFGDEDCAVLVEGSCAHC